MNKFFAQAKEIEREIIARRRDFHKHAESAWTEFRTASIVADALTQLGYEVLVGEQVVDAEQMMGLPSEKVLADCQVRALSEGANPQWVERMTGGKTGVVGIMEFTKPGKTVAIRVDMDANDVQETDDQEHFPNQEGFSSIHPNVMHACGHDGHTSMGLAVAKLIAANKEDFAGKVKIIFQPAEEGVRGARAMVATGIVDDVDYFFGMHIGFNANKENTFICMTDDFLATSKLDAYFKGVSAHAGSAPQNGKNALLAAAQASISLHTISRHGQGASRINVGVIKAGTGRNILPNAAEMKLETRGENTDINEFMMQEALRIIKGAGMVYDVEVTMEEAGGAPACNLDREFGQEVYEAVQKMEIFKEVIPEVSFGASEDCTYFMERVQSRGGKAVYTMCGSNYKAGHHNSKFDFNEADLVNGAAVLSGLMQVFTNK